MAKYLTRSEAATAKDKAAKLMESTGQSDRAEAFRNMSLEEYAQHRGAVLMDNPGNRRPMMATNGMTRAELEDRIDELESQLDEVEEERDELQEQVDSIAEIVSPEGEEEGEAADADEDDD